MIIYKAISPSGKIYVGQTVRPLAVRQSQHCTTRAHTPFGNALKKYGKAIKWSVIDTADSLAELNAKEIHWIAKLNSLAPHGYNANAGGKNALPTAATKDKISAKLTGRKLSAAHKAATAAGMRGRKDTPSARENRANAQRKLWENPEHRARMSATRRGNTNASGKRSIESRKRMSVAQIGNQNAVKSPTVSR